MIGKVVLLHVCNANALVCGCVLYLVRMCSRSRMAQIHSSHGRILIWQTRAVQLRDREIYITVRVKCQMKRPFKVWSCINLTAEQRARRIGVVIRANTQMLQVKQQAGQLMKKAAVIVCVCLSAQTISKCSCGSEVEHCVSSAKGCGFNSEGTHILTKDKSIC